MAGSPGERERRRETDRAHIPRRRAAYGHVKWPRAPERDGERRRVQEGSKRVSLQESAGECRAKRVQESKPVAVT